MKHFDLAQYKSYFPKESYRQVESLLQSSQTSLLVPMCNIPGDNVSLFVGSEVDKSRPGVMIYNASGSKKPIARCADAEGTPGEHYYWGVEEGYRRMGLGDLVRGIKEVKNGRSPLEKAPYTSLFQKLSNHGYEATGIFEDFDAGPEFDIPLSADLLNPAVLAKQYGENLPFTIRLRDVLGGSNG